MENKIPPYILVKSKHNPFRFYKYLHIKGGSGGFYRKGYGGEFDYLLFYAFPEEMEGCDCCEKVWCEENNIPFGIGKDIDEAYDNYLKKLNRNQTVKESDTTMPDSDSKV